MKVSVKPESIIRNDSAAKKSVTPIKEKKVNFNDKQEIQEFKPSDDQYGDNGTEAAAPK